MKLRETLKNYGGFTVDVTTDEEVGDILVAIKYEDHGDEFLYVKTYSGEEYEYGYYLDRNDCFSNFDITKNSGESDHYFIRRPIMYYDMTSKKIAEASNKIFLIIHNDHYGMTEWMTTWKVEKRYNASYIVNEVIRAVDDVIESKVYYDFKRYKKLVTDFAILNELGEETLNKIEKIKWSIDGDAGIAGKTKSDYGIYMDKIISILYRGKNFDIKKVHQKHVRTDGWGCDTYRLSTKQFQ